MTKSDALQSCRMLVLFQHAIEDEIGDALCQWFAQPTSQSHVTLARLLWRQGKSIQDHLLDRILFDENPFTLAAEEGALSDALLAAARSDLNHLCSIFRAAPVGGTPPLPPFLPPATGIRAELAQAPDWRGLTEPLAAHIRANGAGVMGRYTAFRWEAGALQPITNTDPITLDELVGNAESKAVVLKNTEQFLKGLPANNLLLYGDRGTGKSSTVKAVLNRYAPEGLRLVEVSRSDLRDVGTVMQQMVDRPQRFILFMDDLSFEDFEAEYKMFKAVLEGSVQRRPENVLVYATSNRRHLIRERWGDRPSPADEEVHAGDTMEEKLSLADRFGLTVVFTTPDQEQYLEIVRSMAEGRRIPLPWEEIRRRAISWEMWNNGRSGRTARQFIDDLSGELGLPSA